VVQISISQDACRGCQLCVDECPVDVITFDETEERASVSHANDCIACLSCSYLCPSGALSIQDYHVVNNFYRDLHFIKIAEKFL